MIDDAANDELDGVSTIKASVTSNCTARSEAHSDPNTGQSWSTAWHCGNDSGAAMYLGANNSTRVAFMDSTNSWFVCYRRGETHGGGNNVWYYTQGDRSAAGWSGRHAWGYMPAVNVWTKTDPNPGIPECLPDMWQTELSVSDPNTGASWSTVWTGHNTSGTTLYKDASAITPVGYLDSTTSWFVCYARGARYAGFDVWYYTRGGRATSGWAARNAWGFMPALSMHTRSDPYDGIPPCPFGGDGGDDGSGICPAPTAPMLFPVRGRHKTGLFDDQASADPSLWSCDNAAQMRRRPACCLRSRWRSGGSMPGPGMA